MKAKYGLNSKHNLQMLIAVHNAPQWVRENDDICFEETLGLLLCFYDHISFKENVITDNVEHI